MMDGMDLDPQGLRRMVYEGILERGMPPSVKEIASHFRVATDDARESLARLKIGKTVLVDPRSGEVWMAGPFSAKPTDYRVVGARTKWFANCAWDMLGVAVLANECVTVETHCVDCGDEMVFDVDPRAGTTLDAIVHFLVPARRWYDDIGFT